VRRPGRLALTALAVAIPAAALFVAAASDAASRPDVRGLPAADAKAVLAAPGWTRLARPPRAAFRPLGAAHPGTKRVVVSETRAQLTRNGRQAYPYPRGTVVVKTGTTGSVVTLIAIMRKVRAANPKNGGWSFHEYTRSSAAEAFRRTSFPESGCADCHQNAARTQRTDWVFYSLR